jgi:hypothetical protein
MRHHMLLACLRGNSAALRAWALDAHALAEEEVYIQSKSMNKVEAPGRDRVTPAILAHAE